VAVSAQRVTTALVHTSANPLDKPGHRRDFSIFAGQPRARHIAPNALASLVLKTRNQLFP
jgi:hypothetical protein